MVSVTFTASIVVLVCGETVHHGRKAWWRKVVHLMMARRGGSQYILQRYTYNDLLPPTRLHLLSFYHLLIVAPMGDQDFHT
jgi:hypothetical protein